MIITTIRTGPGTFTVLEDGVATAFGIINGSHGYRGNGAGNTYGITKNGELVRWIGSLQSCKKLAARWHAAEAAKARHGSPDRAFGTEG